MNPDLKPIPIDEPYVNVKDVETLIKPNYNSMRFKQINSLIPTWSLKHIDSSTGYINTIPVNFIDIVSNSIQ